MQMYQAATTTPRQDSLSATFAALADPTRRAVLARLAKGEATVTELAAPFDLSLPAICNFQEAVAAKGQVPDAVVVAVVIVK